LAGAFSLVVRIVITLMRMTDAPSVHGVSTHAVHAHTHANMPVSIALSARSHACALIERIQNPSITKL
jgi:hypothetical protein